MEQLSQIIHQIYWMLKLLSAYSCDEREELVEGYHSFLVEVGKILATLDRIVEGCVYWGWKFDWGYQPWQLRTYCEQKGLTLQVGWEDRVDFDINLYQDMPSWSSKIPDPIALPKPLVPIDLDAEGVREAESGILTDVCRVCYIQHERPVVFHELIPGDSDSPSEEENTNVAHRLPIVEENSDADSMPELEDEIDLDTIEIPLWLIPRGVAITFRGGRMEFEREQEPPW